MSRLSYFESLLLDFNSISNIISKSTSTDIWKRHFADSAKLYCIMESIIRRRPNKVHKICDVGSGAGFPGLILDILNRDKGLNINLTLVESNKKKYDFLLDASSKLDLGSFIVNDRAENLNEKFDLIVARAVAPLPKLFQYCSKIKKKDSIYILPKGKTWEDELDQLKKKWNYKVNIVKNNELIDNSGGVTLVFSDVKKNE